MEDSFPRPLRTPVLHQEWCFERLKNHENSCFRPHIGLQDLPFKRRKTALFRNYQQLREYVSTTKARSSIGFSRPTPELFVYSRDTCLASWFSFILAVKEGQPASFPGHLCPSLFCPPPRPPLQKLLNTRTSSDPPDQVLTVSSYLRNRIEVCK